MEFSVLARLMDITLHIMTLFECLLLLPFTASYRLLDKAGKCIYYYLLASALGVLIGNTMARLAYNNMWFMALLVMVQFIPLSRFYYVVIKNRHVKRFIQACFPVALIIFFLDLSWWHGPYTHNGIFVTVRNSLLLVYGAVFAIQQLFDRELVNNAVFVNSIPDFWFNAGLFVFNCTFFLMGLAFNMYHQSITYFTMAVQLVYMSGIIQFIFFYIGLLKTRKQTGHKTD